MSNNIVVQNDNSEVVAYEDKDLRGKFAEITVSIASELAMIYGMDIAKRISIREIAYFADLARNNYELLNSPKKEIISVILSVIGMGLTLNKMAKHVYVHKRANGGKKVGDKWVTNPDILVCTPAANGLMLLYERINKDFVGINIIRVYKGDQYGYDTECAGRIVNYQPTKLQDERDEDPWKDLNFIYCEIKYKHGAFIYESMSARGLLQRRRESGGYDKKAGKSRKPEYDPWEKWTIEMMNKTILKYILDKRVPKDFENPEFKAYLENEIANQRIVERENRDSLQIKS